MPSDDPALTIGPVRCAWFAYRRGAPAEPQARQWLSRELRLPYAALGLQRDPHGRPQLDLVRAREVRIEGPPDIVAQGDGEPLAPLPLTVSVVPSALQVVAPALT